MNDTERHEQLTKEIASLRSELQFFKGTFNPLIEHMPLGFSLHEILFDDFNKAVDCRCLSVNPCLMNMTNVDGSQIIGMTFQDMPSTFKVIGDLYIDVARSGKPHRFDFFSPHTRKHFNINIYFPDPDHIASIVIDITSQKEAESELALTKERAEQSDQLKTAFLSNISHEIRTPMNGIVGFAEMLNEPDISQADRLDYTTIINRECKKLLNIVNDIVDISKIEAGLVELEENEISLNDTVLDIYSQHKVAATKKKIYLEIGDLMPDEKSLIYIDKKKFKQILDNLLSNAIKFTNSGSVKLEYELIGDNLKFAVHDTGSGIDKRDLQLIFERFRQLNFNLSRHHGGNGLGLAISKGIIEKMGGEIWVESEPNKGSSFFFTIPYRAISQADNPSATLLKDKNQYSGKILIIEDEDYKQVYNTELILRLGYTLIHTRSVVEARKICIQNPDLIIIFMGAHLKDIAMDDAILRIKEHLPQIPIIIQSDNVSLAEREHALSAGCKEYISKPSRKEVLLETIEMYKYQPVV